MKKTGLPRGIVIAIVLFLLASLLACQIPGMVEKPTKPAVVINSPPSGTQVKVGEEAEVHSTATDEKGVTRVELWVDGALVRSDQSPTPQPVFSLVQRWTPPGSGSHTVEVRAYNVDGMGSEPAVIVVNVVEAVAASPTATELVVGPTPTSTSPLPPTPTAIPPTPVQPLGVFKIAVLVDTSSEPVTQADTEMVIQEASSILLRLTGFVFEMVDFVETSPPADTRRGNLAQHYLTSQATTIPNGIVVFSYGDDDFARIMGGYSFQVPGPAGFRNAFVSPVYGGDKVYVGFIHRSHRYARCGYGDGEVPISDTSIGGECRNQPGTACVMHNGYSMCQNAVDNLYASTPTYFVSSSIVHEFMHSFGPNVEYDHYGTPVCKEAMGWTDDNWTFSLEEAEICSGMCPYVYDNLVASYQP